MLGASPLGSLLLLFTHVLFPLIYSEARSHSVGQADLTQDSCGSFLERELKQGANVPDLLVISLQMIGPGHPLLS